MAAALIDMLDSLSLVAVMFPALLWFGVIVSIFVLAILAGLARLVWDICKRRAPQRKRLRKWASASVVLLPVAVVAGLMLHGQFLSISIPRGATDVEVKTEPFFSIVVDDRARFRLPEASFQKWVEKLCGRPWAEIQSSSDEIDRQRDGDFELDGGWASEETSKVKRGYRVSGSSGRSFDGEIVYDRDREIVFYQYLAK